MSQSFASDPPKKGNSFPTGLIKWVITILSLGLLVWLISRQNWDQIIKSITKIPWWIILAVVGFNFLGQVLNTLRWFTLLRSQHVMITFGQLLKIVLSGAFASNFLPSTIGGDVVRLVKINRFNKDTVLNFSSIVLDRFVNVLSFLTVLPFSLSLGIPGDLQDKSSLALFSGFNIPRIKNWFRKIWEQFLQAYKNWSSQPLILIRAFIISWFSIFVIFIGLWLLNVGLGIQVRLVQVMGISALSYFVTLLPISINGFGVREVSFTFFYTLVGVSPEIAALFAILSRFLIVLVTFPGAFFLGDFKKIIQSKQYSKNLPSS